MTLKDSFVKEILKIFHREDVKDESYPEFCADQLLYYPFH